jgi:SAM-dependent methyltransferase
VTARDGWVAQLVEQRTENPRVAGSIPAPAIFSGATGRSQMSGVKYDWKDAGEEWSAPWGSSAAQWSGAILPRIRDCLPTEMILEIGCGHGRWTHYLKDCCQKLIAVDRIADSVEVCRQRFAGDSRVHCYVNDGRSLLMARDASLDFVFSFDSLVHVKRDVIEEYLHELASKLKNGGKGFVHHSNFGEYANSLRERIPDALAKLLIKAKILDWSHHRSPDMTADLFRELCVKHGLHCITQELINWRGRRLIDCFSLFVRTGDRNQPMTQVTRNPNFMREAAEIRRQSAVTQSVEQ